MFQEVLKVSYDGSEFNLLDQVIKKIKTNEIKDRNVDDLFQSLESIDFSKQLAHIQTKKQILRQANTKNEILLALYIIKEIKPLDISPLIKLYSMAKNTKHKSFLIKLGKKILNENHKVQHPYLMIQDHLAVAKVFVKDFDFSKEEYIKSMKYQDNYLKHQESGCDERFLTDLCDIFCE